MILTHETTKICTTFFHNGCNLFHNGQRCDMLWLVHNKIVWIVKLCENDVAFVPIKTSHLNTLENMLFKNKKLYLSLLALLDDLNIKKETHKIYQHESYAYAKKF